MDSGPLPLKPVRVVVVDDSPTMRGLLVAMLESAGQIQVVGIGENGEDAVRLTQRMRPDALAMDITMPKMDGLEATRQIMREIPTPIILISGSRVQKDINLTFEALQLGALAVVEKPGLENTRAWEDLIRTIRLMSAVPVVRRWDNSRPTSVPAFPMATARATINERPQIIGIAASTGGPGVLATILGGLSADFPLPILIVQHVTPGFAQGLAEWLNTQTPLQVRLAVHGETPRSGTVLLAPDDCHLRINERNLVELSKDPPYKKFRPSANYLFGSLAQYYGARAVGIELTGMGDDGVEGLLALHRAGGHTLAQDAESSVVYGMPQEAVLQNAVDEILAPTQITEWLNQLVARLK